MNRHDIERELKAAERHVLEGVEKVVRQRRLVERLAADGHDTRLARRILQTFEEVQVTHVAGRDLAKEFVQADMRDPTERETE